MKIPIWKILSILEMVWEVGKWIKRKIKKSEKIQDQKENQVQNQGKPTNEDEVKRHGS